MTVKSILFFYIRDIQMLATSSEKPTHSQAHFILLVPHKIKRAYPSPPPPNKIIVLQILNNR